MVSKIVILTGIGPCGILKMGDYKMDAFHYLVESASGVTPVKRIDSENIEVTLGIHSALESPLCELAVSLHLDERDRRVLVVIDGELLWESIPKNADCIYSETLGNLYTNTHHLREPRFGEPSYNIIEMEDRKLGCLTIKRHFLLIPSGCNFLFRRVRDLRSLGPTYVMGVVRRSDSKDNVMWINSSY